jgi:stearoyl-CoA desaturase (delta-9 desaturase)
MQNQMQRKTFKEWISQFDMTVSLFLILNPLLSVILTVAYAWNAHEVPWAILAFALIFAAATNLSITAGYHRLYSHKSYDAHPLVKALFLLVGSSGFQGSCLKWSSDHRRHHSKIDSENDPYNIHEGFWYAHMGWMFRKDSVDLPIQAPDLQKDRMVLFQDKYYVWIAIATGFIFPMVVGHFLGSALAGLAIAGGLRIALTQQSTFFVNSLCHTLGRQTYSHEISARDSFFVAVLTHGEGYHNFHHKFQIDYRNGIRWYHWDPTKWTILTLKWMGLASKLRQISNAEILKARLQVESLKMKSRGFSEDHLENLKEKILSAQTKMKKLGEDYERLKSEFHDASIAKLEQIKTEMQIAKLEFEMGMKLWRIYLKTVTAS